MPPCPHTHTERDFAATPPRVWKTITNRRRKITRDDLVVISNRVPRWKELARHLGLAEPDIVAIEANYSHDYNEQKLQCLLTWFQGQGSPPTRQALVRIIEEKMQDQELAKDIDTALLSLDIERDSERPRAQSALN